ncbi:hypothetical protein [uncultured Amnibacterium sp.]|uniref:hypothetical protein n=1 Tax=uncultured Amnibacterium sp. TaxID=1631851 RepID=UPI0035C95C9F
MTATVPSAPDPTASHPTNPDPTAPTPTVLDPAEVVARPLAADVARHRVALGLAVLGPILLLAGTVASPDLGGTNAQVLANVPAVADQLLTAHLLNTAGSLAYVVTVLVTLRIPAKVGSVLRLIGGVVAMAGFISNALGEVLDGYAAWAGAVAHVPPAIEARLFDVLDAAPAALPVSWLAIPVAVLGGIVLWIGVLRAHRVVPLWAPVVAIVGAVISALVPTGPLALLGVVGAVGAIATALLADRSARP